MPNPEFTKEEWKLIRYAVNEASFKAAENAIDFGRDNESASRGYDKQSAQLRQIVQKINDSGVAQ